ncbi:hypothetical protein BaRGS_00034962 [Batillaria attramentaria]|uniref:SEFIR domain-containing protein n=1 Tax=Batillaria attramentaria TaxID=370345 RepID=A0ABD0JFV8_9CAEN
MRTGFESLWLRMAALVVVAPLMVLQATASCYASCDCSSVTCSLEDGTSCDVTLNATCGGLYVYQLPVTSTEGQQQTVNVAVSWVPGEDEPPSPKNVTYVPSRTTVGRLIVDGTFIIPVSHTVTTATLSDVSCPIESPAADVSCPIGIEMTAELTLQNVNETDHMGVEMHVFYLLPGGNRSAGEVTSSTSPDRTDSGDKVSNYMSPSDSGIGDTSRTDYPGSEITRDKGRVAASSKDTTNTKSLEQAPTLSSFTTSASGLVVDTTLTEATSDVTTANATSSVVTTESNQSADRGSRGITSPVDVITVLIVGFLVLAAIIALGLAIRQTYRRATHRHNFKPIKPDLQGSSRYSRKSAIPDSPADDTSQTSVEMAEQAENPLGRTRHDERSPPACATLTPRTKDVVLIYDGDSKRHVHNVQLFRHELAQRLGSQFRFHEWVISEVLSKECLPPRDSRGKVKIILMLSPGIKDMLTGSNPSADPQAVKQFLCHILQSTPCYYLVLLVKRDVITGDDVKFFSAIFPVVERTYEIKDSECEQFHSLVEEIIKDDERTDSVVEFDSRSFDLPSSVCDVTSLELQKRFQKLNDANDNWSEAPRSLSVQQSVISV